MFSNASCTVETLGETYAVSVLLGSAEGQTESSFDLRDQFFPMIDSK